MAEKRSVENNIGWFCVDRFASSQPGAIALLCEDNQISYEQLRAQTDRAAQAMLNLGCREQDRVLVCLPDSIDFVVAFFGIAKMGAIAVPVDPFATAADLEYFVRDIEPSAVIADASVYDHFAALPSGRRIAVRNTQGGGVSRWQDLITAAEPMSCQPVAMEDPVCFLYTSGSTGSQKAVVHAHRAIIRIGENVVRDVLGIDRHDRVLSVSKLPFAFGLGGGMHFPLSVGASSILNPKRPELATIAELIRRHRPSILSGVPSFWDIFLGSTETWLDVDLSSIRLVISAGEPLPVRVFQRFREQFGIEVVEGLGSTEMLHFISNRPTEARAGSCGLPIPGCEIELRGEDDAPVASGEIGTLWARSETAFVRYWNRPEQTARAKIGGWVSTGDKLHRDDAGYLHYCGRIDDMLKIAGMWVSPRDVESALCQYKGVARAAVTTREDEWGRKRLVAYVTAEDGADLNEAELWKYAGDHLPAHTLPSGIKVLAALPLTRNGKLNRPALPPPIWTTSTS